MKPWIAARGLNRLMERVYLYLTRVSTTSSFIGRLMSVPCGLFMLLIIPLAKLALFLESASVLFLNLAGCAFNPHCSLADAWFSLKSLLMSFIGLVLSPITAIFTGVSIFTAMMVDPVKATQSFIQAGRSHPTGRDSGSP